MVTCVLVNNNNNINNNNNNNNDNTVSTYPRINLAEIKIPLKVPAKQSLVIKVHGKIICKEKVDIKSDTV